MNSKQATGGDCKSSPGDKIKGAVLRKANPKRLDSRGGSHSRGSGNERK
jgi:hypothetical protein